MPGIVVTVDLDVKSEAIDGLTIGLPEMIKDTAKRPGFIDIRVVREEGTNHVLFVERWESEQAYDDYVAWRTGRGDMDGFMQALNAPPKKTIFKETIAAI